MSADTCQPRYVAYARAHGLDPDAMLERDRERWPGGAMVGYVVWIAERWREWRAETGRESPAFGRDHAEFDAWLEARVAPAQLELMEVA